MIRQCDREAAAKITAVAELRPMMLNGTFDHHPYIEAMSDHREAAIAEVIAWLWEQAAVAEKKCEAATTPEQQRNYAAGSVTCKRLAQAIERSDYLTNPAP